ncbi:MAG: cell division/cell wall cluster transcriptional repressor MraZ [Clostridia bacterium]|nr:cell division/cell wall cluster transcriptional repressor MraZ [Clostridia bacterium]
MQYLIGEFNHQIDNKNRIRIPNKLAGDEKGFYFAPGLDGCLNVYYEEAFNALTTQLRDKYKTSDVEGQKAIRTFAKNFEWIEGDAQGRMILPAQLKEYAKIVKDIVTCGAGSHIEIWAKEVHDEYFKNEKENLGAVYMNLDICL